MIEIHSFGVQLSRVAGWRVAGGVYSKQPNARIFSWSGDRGHSGHEAAVLILRRRGSGHPPSPDCSIAQFSPADISSDDDDAPPFSPPPVQPSPLSHAHTSVANNPGEPPGPA